MSQHDSGRTQHIANGKDSSKTVFHALISEDPTLRVKRHSEFFQTEARSVGLPPGAYQDLVDFDGERRFTEGPDRTANPRQSPAICRRNAPALPLFGSAGT